MTKKKKPKLGKKTKKNAPFKLNIIYDEEDVEPPTSDTESKEEDYSKMYI
jgi:hypothetical protein